MDAITMQQQLAEPPLRSVVQPRYSGQVLAIANQKGGVGKTTTAVTLGAALRRLGKRVLVVDLDPHANASIHLAVFPDPARRSSYELFLPQVQDPQGAVLRDERTGLDILPGHIRLSELDVDLKGQAGKGLLLRNSLAGLRRNYDHVLLDCPPHVGIIMVNALVAADELLIPIQTDFLALHGVKLLFDTMRVLNKVQSKPIRYRALPTMCDMRTSASRRVLSILRERLGSRMYETVIGMDTKFREASARGSVIFNVDPVSRGALQYTRLAQEVVVQ